MFVAVSASALLGASQEATLVPESDWAAGIVEGRCIISRRYAGAGGEAAIELSRAPWGAGTSWEMILPRQLDDPKAKGSLVFRTVPSGIEQVSDIAPRRVGGPGSGSDLRYTILTRLAVDGRIIRGMTLRNDVVEALAGASAVEIQIGKRAPVTLTFSGGTVALNTLDSCERRLAKEWGIDLNETARIAVGAKPIFPETWVTTADYPAEALRKRAAGKSLVLFYIEADGRVRSCGPITSSGHDILDQAACSALRSRARAAPARASDGTAIRQPFIRSINWNTP